MATTSSNADTWTDLGNGMIKNDRLGTVVPKSRHPHALGKAADNFRDIGNGMIRDDRTAAVVPIADMRPPPKTPRGPHVIELTPQEWKKLEALAEHNTNTHPKRLKHTPEGCVRAFIASAIVKPAWVHPEVS